MRPETLLVEGLRSYRDPTEIDFTRLGLSAVIGDTGAGKSSIIEALSVALYNRATWSGRDVQSLRADHAPAMRVVLTFAVGRGDHRRRWTVTRIHRTSGAPVHRLECAETGEKVDGASAINQRIESLVGLSHEQFTKAIVIPQGQFARLLASTPAERTTILKRVFRLDHLSAIKGHADVLLGRFRDPVAERRGRRRSLPGDPDAEIARAEDELATARAAQARIADALDAIAEHDAAAKAARAAESALASAAREVADRVDTGTASALAAAEAAEAEIDAARAAARTARATAECEAGDADARAAAAIQPFGAREEAGQARAVLAATAEDATRWAQRAEDLEARAARLDDPARAQHRAAAGDRAAHARAEAELAATGAAGAARTSAEADEAVARAVAAQRSIEQAVAAADVAVGSARRALDVARDANALAAVAGTCTPGDDCPVCARPLPGDFVAPTDAGIEDARRALGGAETDLARARAGLPGAQEAHAAATTAAREARALLDEAREAARAAERAADEAQGTLDRLVDEEERERRAVADARAELERERATCEARVASLPAPFAVAFGDEAGTTAAIGVIDGMLTAAADATAAATRARTRATSAAQAERDATDRYRREVQGAVTAVRDRAGTLVDHLDRLATLVPGAGAAGEAPRPGPGADAPVATLRTWVESLHAAAGALVERATGLAADHARQAAEAEAEIARGCAAHGAVDPGELRTAAQQAVAAAAVAAEALTRARATAREAAQLDDFLGVGEPFVANLETLSQTLTDGKFVRALVAERERELLVEASRQLGRLSGDTFGFGADFTVVDRRSGQQRSPDTLSGGERFLASLALALGLVEIATRGGGQLDAMFLDEGFGSLDAASLDQALEALGSLAVGGKLVVLVSHLRRVAEHVEQVLLVERDDTTGSRVHLLDGDERDRLLADDARAGLTL